MGALVRPQTVFELGKEWYATRLDPDWQRPGAAESQAILERHGLTGEFWSLV